MLAEKFFLVLETLRSHASDDESQTVIGTTRDFQSLHRTGNWFGR